MYKFTKGIVPLVMVLTKMYFFKNNYYYSEFDSDSCVMFLYTKKDKFVTKIGYAQDKILPQPQELYTGMPVTNYRSATAPTAQYRGYCKSSRVNLSKNVNRIYIKFLPWNQYYILFIKN